MDDRKVKELSAEGVICRVQPTKHFVYSVRVTWSDGMVNVVYRRYKQFLDLEKQLRDNFPNKKDSIPTLRTKSPNFPGTAIKFVNELAAFVETLINLPTYISSCGRVLDFFTLTEQDLVSMTQKGATKPSKVTPEKKNKSKTKSQKKKGYRRNRFTRRRTRSMKDGLISGPVQFEQYTVLETYKKQNKNDINLTEGQVVEVIEKRNNGWWFVEADEQLGWAPASFLQTTDFDVKDDFNITRFPRGKGEIYMTTKSYKAAMEDELSFDIGVYLQIVEKNYVGWWRAVYMGMEGYVPAVYLKKIGSGRFSVQQNARKEKTVAVVSSLEETILVESGDVYMTTKSYKAAMEDELSFDIGVNLQIVERNYAGWWRALYLGEEGYVPAEYLKKIGSGRHSVLQRHTREKNNSVVSRLEETIQEEPGVSFEESSEGRTRKISIPNVHWRHSLPPDFASRCAPGNLESTTKHMSVPRSGGPSMQPKSHVSFSEDVMRSIGETDEVNVDGSEERAAPISGSEESSASSEAISLSSLNKQNFTADQSPVLSKTSSLLESHQLTHEEDRLENDVKNGNQADGVGNDVSEIHSEEVGEQEEEEEEKGEDDGEEEEEEEREDNGEKREEDEAEMVQASGPLPSPLLPPPPQEQERGAMQTRKGISNTECYEQTLSNIQESDDSSFDEATVFTIDNSELSDDPQQMQNQQNFRSIASYEGDESSNELTLTEGEIVQVIQRKASDWWLALAHREMGWVPSNYLVPLLWSAQGHIPHESEAEESNNTRL